MLSTKSPALVLALLVAAGAVGHGALTQRWSVFEPDAARSERMHALRIDLADCEVEEIEHDVPLKERSVATSRRYRAADGSFTAAVSIVSGVPGAVSTHTPDVCYPASGYRMLGEVRRETITLTKGEAKVFVADFEKKRESTVERLRIRWAWTTDGAWAAPDRARFHYMRAGELFKIYIATPLAEVDGKPGPDSAAIGRFLRAAFEQSAAAFRGPLLTDDRHP